ncbi:MULTISPECIES: sugar porter family MFS transporter [Olivibacter]|uniref:Sugar porter family MFS transporter n=1 Tax=Olivibacter jilunii TaxID=985016 RepID=A0ABW6B276_9SPHI|nr:sugar porter family MFS transporter [Olivibacter sp. 47]MCL4638073.1 sugar porter family MFS transporter [Olivibacter sp. UJ_SKK_5.1]MDM8173002.1 sugar porter family MFS transporter [Olivibacter sp. 47]MDX3915569.1 sugar porter family MFS transporter [Pseudosphingobacterium sp.]
MTYPTRIALIAALGGFLFGFETAVISGAEKTIQEFWKLDAFWLGFTVAASLIGTVLGSLIIGSPAQKYGRKKVLIGIALFYLLSAVGCALAQQWILFVLFRFLGGIAVGASSVVGPMYIAEISPARIRGRLAGMFQLNIVGGILVAYLTNYLLSGTGEENAWRYMLGVMAAPAVLFFILLQFIPESPRWLVLNGKDQEAERIFIRLGEQGAAQLIREEHRLAAGGTREKLFNGKYNKPIFYAILLAMFNQLSGINAILYYAPRIFEMAGFNKADAFQQSVYIGLANFLFTALAMTLIDRFGRKRLLLTGAVGMVFFLALTAVSFSNPAVTDKHVIIYLIGFIAFFAFSQGAVIWVFISEIFPNSVRSQGGSLGSFTHWIMAAIISWIFPIIVEGSAMGGFYSFVFYSVMMFLSFLFIWRVMPETKGKSLEQIQKELGI